MPEQPQVEPDHVLTGESGSTSFTVQTPHGLVMISSLLPDLTTVAVYQNLDCPTAEVLIGPHSYAKES